MPWGKAKPVEQTVQCSLVKTPTIFIEAVPRQKISLLMEEYPHQEWLAYLVGRVSDKDNIFVENISIPPHEEASGATATAEPFHIPAKCVGVMHSHHHMGAFHSGTDQSYVDKNFPVSITVAINGENALIFDAISYQETPCKKGVTIKCQVKYVQPPPMFNKEKFLTHAKENIDKGKKVWKNVQDFGQESYLPVRFRQKGLAFGEEEDRGTLTDIVIDGHGHALTKTEVEDILANSERGKD